MNRLNIIYLSVIVLITSLTFSCASTPEESLARLNKEFLTGGIDENTKETFRVLMTSEKYTVNQVQHKGDIKRVKDPGGDIYICDELRKYNKINEDREGTFKIWLYPDRGTLMKIRPQKSTLLLEIDKLIIEDIQRWSFKFPRGAITPLQLFIRYRVVLRKKQTDKKIINELNKKMN